MSRWFCSFVLVLVVIGPTGCGSSGKKPLPGAMCVMNSECNNPLSCTYGRCHVTCLEPRDCDPGQQCVGPRGEGVCILPEEETCGLNSDCPGALFCAIDLKCRTQCQTEKDCTTETQRCVPSVSDVNVKVCAEPEEGETLQPPADAGVGPGGAVDSGTGTDAPTADGGTSGADGAPGPDGGEAGGSVVPGTEVEPNDDRDHATPISPETPVVGSVGGATDIDFFELFVPATDLAGGYYQASITDVGDGTVRAVVYTATDNNMIHQATTGTRGASVFFYWAAAAGQKYRVAINRAGNLAVPPYNYTLKVVYTKIDDAFEPNDVREGAAPKMLTLGAPVSAHYFTGYRTLAIDVNYYEDWFYVDLAASMTTVKIENVATNWRPMVTAIDEMGNDLGVARTIATGAGATLNGTFMVTVPGRYRMLIKGYANQSISEAGTSMTVPDNFTRPYTLTVSQ